MTSYQHRDKAGNVADVHKHWLLSLLLQDRLPGPLHYLESHAGAGRYSLPDMGSHESGIGLLRNSGNRLPDSLQRYLDLSLDGTHRPYYNGSPLLAAHYLGPQDRATLFELHGQPFTELKAQLAADPRFALHQGDGYRGVAGILEHHSGQTLLLVDPPYVSRSDYTAVIGLLERVTGRDEGRRVVIWHPCFHDRREEGFRRRLRTSLGQRYWESKLTLTQVEGRGLCGSVICVFNAPQQAIAQAEEEGPALARLLGGRMRYWRPS